MSFLVDSDIESNILETIDSSMYKDLLSQEVAKHGEKETKSRRRKKKVRKTRK